jgi:DNA-binding CsgD family transcriptional regulator
MSARRSRRTVSQRAAGKTNRDVAAMLFVTPKTVEFHLTRVYRKLGIHSRSELVRRMADHETDIDLHRPQNDELLGREGNRS